jgi:glycosyltransferase involved in cell wall biosynthesis
MITGRADFGGGPEHVYQLAKAIGQSADVFIACPREEPYWSRYQSLAGPGRMIEIPRRRFTPAALARLVRFIRAQEIDIVHGHGRAAGILARPAALLAGVRCFYTPHGGTPVTGFRTAFYAAVEYLLSAVTHGIIAVSGTEAGTLKSLCAHRDRLEVIPNGVEIPEKPEARETRLGEPLRVLHVTRFVFQKNSHLLLDIMASLRDMGRLDSFEFTLLGDGPGRAEFEAAVASRGLARWVKILGAVNNPGDYLASAFCFVSTSRWEGLPLALLEAMARGVPAIATEVPGNTDAVADHETGFLYQAPEVAAQRLVELAHYPVLWKRMARAARLKAEEEFSVEAMAGATLRLYARSAPPRETAGDGALHSFRHA